MSNTTAAVLIKQEPSIVSFINDSIMAPFPVKKKYDPSKISERINNISANRGGGSPNTKDKDSRFANTLTDKSLLKLRKKSNIQENIANALVKAKSPQS